MDSSYSEGQKFIYDGEMTAGVDGTEMAATTIKPKEVSKVSKID